MSFLDDITLTLGLGIITSGTVKSSALSPHNACLNHPTDGCDKSESEVSGNRFMVFLVKNFRKWELLGGYQHSTYKYETTKGDYSASGGLMVIGFGMGF